MNTAEIRRVLVADPNATRQKVILTACDGRSDIRAVGASTIAETYRQCEALSPHYILVASEFERMGGFGGLLSLFELVGAEIVILGATAGSGAAYRTARVASPDDALSLLAALVPTASPRMAETQPARPATTAPRPASSAEGRTPEIVAIGASTGGIVAIEKILRSFPADCPPTLVVQHIRPGFSESVVRRLDGLVQPRVVAADDGLPVRRGTVYFAHAADRHLTLVSRAGLHTRLSDAPAMSGHRPSIDMMFLSLAALAGRFRISAALLTGMGADGAEGMAELRQSEAFTIAQDKETSVVWGMPQAAIRLGGAASVLPLDDIAEALLTGRAASARAGQVVP